MPKISFKGPPRKPRVDRGASNRVEDQIPEPPSGMGLGGLPESQDAQKRAKWRAWREKTHGSYPEFICYEYLTDRLNMKDGVDFHYQYNFSGGRTFYGGQVIDFFFPTTRIAWMVQGEFWHIVNPKDRAAVILSRQSVQSQGMIPVELYEDDVIERPDYTIRLALQGREVKR